MEEIIIKVPRNLILDLTIEFISSFKDIRKQAKYVFDFEEQRRIDPFSLLLLSSELTLFKGQNLGSEFVARNFKHCEYPAHMGFFQAFGMNYGNIPNTVVRNNDRYIPMRLFNVSDIKQAARDMNVNPGEVLQDYAEDIGKVLTQDSKEANGPDDKILREILSYSIREILRNIVEHSNSKQFGFCAQYLPSQDVVSFSVLDRGMGIRNSLLNNPKLTLKSDLEAIRESLKPGVSGKVYAGQKNKPKGIWANSGFGLYMTSNICKMGGSFFIASGDKGLYFTDKDEKILAVKIEGTAINLAINLNQKNKLSEILKKLRDSAGSTDIKASQSTMNKSRSKSNNE